MEYFPQLINEIRKQTHDLYLLEIIIIYFWYSKEIIQELTTGVIYSEGMYNNNAKN